MATRNAVGTPISKFSGPAFTVVLHSPAAGASASLTIKKIATHAVLTRAIRLKSTIRRVFFTGSFLRSVWPR
ncbi:Uncharacterised protein [Mycobacterium tuberculosis]|nr:Uncharacterised protein [Mycobacterium tuberculosis]